MAPPAETTKNQPSFTTVSAGPGGQSILLPDSQVAAWQGLVESIHRKFAPEPGLEERLVQAIVHNEWRLNRSVELRAALDRLPGDNGKSLKNLQLQEKRLRQYLKLDTAELTRMQTERLNSRRHRLFLVPKREKY